VTQRVRADAAESGFPEEGIEHLPDEVGLCSSLATEEQGLSTPALGGCLTVVLDAVAFQLVSELEGHVHRRIFPFFGSAAVL
jgi:hypothetical protein